MKPRNYTAGVHLVDHGRCDDVALATDMLVMQWGHDEDKTVAKDGIYPGMSGDEYEGRMIEGDDYSLIVVPFMDLENVPEFACLKPYHVFIGAHYADGAMDLWGYEDLASAEFDFEQIGR